MLHLYSLRSLNILLSLVYAFIYDVNTYICSCTESIKSYKTVTTF